MDGGGEIGAAPPRSLLDRALDRVSTVVMWAAGAGLVTITVVTGWLVWGRYVMNATPTWTEQVSLLLVVAIAFLGAAIGVWQETHLAVDMFREALPPKAKLVVLIFNELVLGTFGVLMAWFGWKLVLFKWRSKIPLLDLPEGLRSLPLAICGALLAIFCVARIIRHIRAAKG